MLADIIRRLCPPMSDSDRYNFGIESADGVADFFNNGGLEFHNGRLNYALQYAAVTEGCVYVGAWVWFDGEDFDQDATFEVYEEDDFSGGELQLIYNRIKEIYGNTD